MSLIVKENLENEGNTWKFNIAGELDVSCANELKEKIEKKLEEKMADIVLDFENLQYIDSTGLGIIVGIMKNLKKNDKDISIVKAKDNVKKIFNITGLDQIISMEG
ncbi:STAS domain-containing protein [Peptostreptococcus equinus]|uniref:Anti-sigma factor antagonist n=1 Tax=Peptostreptococcus equinus TaxID=3003601 RepID=A0ABY7JR02_9FIRM|nr:STAS domain-containing protein [Peptostreptococcus sp. CBA3647]WAW14924.1 STAS domain-containing protein [Peptostreptococcus sp. CBA3647]